MTAAAGDVAAGAASGAARQGVSSAGPARTIFLGSGSFAVPILEALVASPETDVVAVVSAPDRPVGRGAIVTPVPVAARAREDALAKAGRLTLGADNDAAVYPKLSRLLKRGRAAQLLDEERGVR